MLNDVKRDGNERGPYFSDRIVPCLMLVYVGEPIRRYKIVAKTVPLYELGGILDDCDDLVSLHDWRTD